MKSLIKRLNARYGDLWFTFQPPGARPIRVIENTGIQLGTPVYLCRSNVRTNEILVIESYSLKLLAVVQNPYWLGNYTIEMPPYSLQGRMKWQPVANRAPIYEVNSFVNHFVYAWNPPAPLIPDKHDGFSLLGEYRWPRLLINPGQYFEIAISGIDPDAGLDPWGVDLSLVAEVSGYYLTMPEKITEEIYEERVEEHSNNFIEMLANKMMNPRPPSPTTRKR